MSDPRTPRHVADFGLFVLIACRCGHEEAMDPLMVEFIYGDDFDLVGSTVYVPMQGMRVTQAGGNHRRPGGRPPLADIVNK